MPQDVRRHATEFCSGANPVEYPHDADEMPIANVGREHIGRMPLYRLAFDAFNCRDADYPKLFAALGIGEVDGVTLAIEPSALKAEGLHPPEARQQQESDCAKPRWMLAVSHPAPHYLTEVAHLVGTQPALDLP